MLHEIFKGMDNSAEQINENFKNGSVVDSGETSEYRFLSMGNGTVIITLEINFDRSGTGDIRVDFPFPLKDDRYNVFLTAATGSINTIQDSDGVISAPSSLTQLRIVKKTGFTFSGTGILPLRATVIGKI